MKQLDPKTISLIGFAASQWAGERLNGSRHRQQYRRLVTAGLHLHEHGELYAAAPKLHRTLRAVAKTVSHLAVVVLLAACATVLEPEPEPPPAPVAPATRMVTINIHSLPPGALIYKNADFLGFAPLQHTVEADAQGNWRQGARFQCYVPHDTRRHEQARYPAGSAVPKTILLRVPGYTDWYSATRRHPVPKPQLVY